MADSVLSVRVDDQLKERFFELAREEQINNKELIQLLVNQFELEKMKTGKFNFSSDIEELQKLTKRMGDIFVNMVGKVQQHELEEVNQENKALEVARQETEKLKETIKELKEELEKTQLLKKEIDKLKKALKQQEEDTVVIKDLNLMLKTQNADLTEKIKTLSAQETQITQMKEVNVQYERKVSDLSAKLDELNRQAADKEKQWEFTLREQELKFQEQKIALQQEFQEQLNQLRINANNKKG